MSTSSATGIVVAEIHVERDQSPDDGSSSTSRQPSATAAAARLPPEDPSIVLQCHLHRLLRYLKQMGNVTFPRFPHFKKFLKTFLLHFYIYATVVQLFGLYSYVPVNALILN